MSHSFAGPAARCCFVGVTVACSVLVAGRSRPANCDDALTKLVDSIESAVAVSTEMAPGDAMRELQSEAIRNQNASWGHWGNQPGQYSTWTNHSNRLVPIYTFGITLGMLRERGSLYADADRLRERYGVLPKRTLNPVANYHDQTDVPDLMRAAVEQGKRHVILMIFDGMDWQTTRAAAIFRSGKVGYDSGRGTGLSFQDYRGVKTDFGFLVTSAATDGEKPDVDAQTIGGPSPVTGGFDPKLAGPMPWHEETRSDYPIGRNREVDHTVTDSAASATSLFGGVKTYNGAIGVDINGKPVRSIAHQLQEEGFRVGVVTSVPISHATPASAYSHNVSRKDMQDIARDMLGLPSAFHRRDPLSGLDVVIGAGWGEGSGKDKTQGENFLPGNPNLHQSDIERVERSARNPRGRYIVAQRTEGRLGSEVLGQAAAIARRDHAPLLGFFGTKSGHLPFQTADGNFNPTFDVTGAERYEPGDVTENPTLKEMTLAALDTLAFPGVENPAASADGPLMAKFWLAVEEGDVDWANHANNLDNSIGAVLSGADAFQAIVDWIESHDAWKDTALILTSDHGHFLVLDDAEAIANAAH